MLGLTRLAPIASRQDLCFSKVVSKCTSFVIVSQAFETTKRNGLPCLGDLSAEQTMARQTQLLPLIVQKSISYLRIWVRPRHRPAPHCPNRRRRRPRPLHTHTPQRAPAAPSTRTT